MGHVMGELDVLVAADDDRDVAVRSGLHQHPGVGNHACLLEAADQCDVALHMFGQLAHHHRHRVPEWKFGKPHQVRPFGVRRGVLHAERGQAWDRVAKR